MSDETQSEASEVRAGQRIAKVMARAGVCSRRDAEAWIAEGRVSVNGEVLKSPAFNVSETDDVRVDGKPLAAAERTRLFLFHKPRGLVTTARDPEGRPTVFAALPPDLPRLVAIGRLDINTEGLLLLTNDGGLARVLELPSTGWLRRYRVRAHGTIDQAALDRLSDGVTIDGVDYLGVEARLDREQGSNAWLTLGLREGKNREIKKILEHLGLAVNRLIRVSFGPFELGDLPEGEVMEVRTRVLRDQLGVKLAKEANVNFDAPQIVADASPSERRQGERPRSERGPRENRGPKRAMQGRPDRGASGGENRFEREAAPRRAPPKPSTPERRRKHVSALRAEIAADAATTRKRIERSATHDRKGRTIAVERMSRAGEDAAHAAAETQPKRSGRPNAGERGGRSFESGGRAGRGDSFGPKRGGAAGGRERPARPDRGRRPEHASSRERSIAEMAAANADADPAREEFERPQAGRAEAARADRDRTRSGGPSAASIVPQRSGTAIAEMARHERGTAPSRRANASLSGLRAGRALKPAKADRNDRTTRTAAPAPTSSQDRPAQAGVTEIGRRPATVAPAEKADSRVADPHPSGDLARQGKDRRKAPAVRRGRRESGKPCGSSAAASRAARCLRRRRAPFAQPRSACANRSLTFSSTDSRAKSKTRAWLTCSRERGRWRSRLFRAARASRCSSTTALRRARFCAPTSRRWRLAE